MQPRFEPKLPDSKALAVDVYTWIWHGFWDRRPSSLGRKSCFQGQALFTKRHLWGRVFKKRGQLEWGHQWIGLEGSKRKLLFCGKKKRQTCQCLWVHWESAVNQLWQRRAELQASSMVNQLWPYSLQPQAKPRGSQRCKDNDSARPPRGPIWIN